MPYELISINGNHLLRKTDNQSPICIFQNIALGKLFLQFMNHPQFGKIATERMKNYYAEITEDNFYLMVHQALIEKDLDYEKRLIKIGAIITAALEAKDELDNTKRTEQSIRKSDDNNTDLQLS